MAGTESIRDVIAFPKTTTAQCLMTGAPSPIPDKQLAEVHVAVRPKAAGCAIHCPLQERLQPRALASWFYEKLAAEAAPPSAPTSMRQRPRSAEQPTELL